MQTSPIPSSGILQGPSYPCDCDRLARALHCVIDTVSYIWNSFINLLYSIGCFLAACCCPPPSNAPLSAPPAAAGTTPSDIPLSAAPAAVAPPSAECLQPFRLKVRGHANVYLSDPFPNNYSLNLRSKLYIGKHGNRYDMAEQYSTLELPSECLSAFPEAIQTQFRNLDSLLLTFIIHRDFEEHITGGSNVRNLITHPLVCFSYQGIRVQNNFLMGIFEMDGVSVHDDPSYLRPNQFVSTLVEVRPGHAWQVGGDHGRFLPDNCKFEIGAPISSFFTAIDMRGSGGDEGILHQQMGVACFHIVCHSDIDVLNLSEISNFLSFFTKLPPHVQRWMSEFVVRGYPSGHRLWSGP